MLIVLREAPQRLSARRRRDNRTCPYPVGSGAAGGGGCASPIALHSLDDLLNDLLDGLVATLGFGALGVVCFLAQRLVLIDNVAVRLIEDLYVYRNLLAPPRRHRLLRVGAVAILTVCLVRGDHGMDDHI